MHCPQSYVAQSHVQFEKTKQGSIWGPYVLPDKEAVTGSASLIPLKTVWKSALLMPGTPFIFQHADSTSRINLCCPPLTQYFTYHGWLTVLWVSFTLALLLSLKVSWTERLKGILLWLTAAFWYHQSPQFNQYLSSQLCARQCFRLWATSVNKTRP